MNGLVYRKAGTKLNGSVVSLQITAMLTDKHLSEELPPISSRRLAPAPAPYRKALSYVSTGAKVLLGLVIVEAVLLLVFAITSAVIVHHSSHDVYFFVRELTYSIVVIENCIFFVYFAFDGVLYENKFEMTAFALTAIVLIGRVCFFFVTERTDVRLATTITTVRVMSLVVMNAALVCQVIVSFLFVRTWKGFGWRVWNQAKSAKLRVVSAFNFLQTWVSMMKVDIQLSVSLLPLSCFFLYAPSDWQFSVAMVVLIVNVIWALFGWQAMKRQSVAGIGIFLGFMAIEPAYILFKIYELFALDGGRYPAVRCSTSIPCPMFAATGIGIIVLRIALVAVTIKCMTQWPDRRSRQQTQLIQPILVDSLGTQRQRTLTIQAL